MKPLGEYGFGMTANALLSIQLNETIDTRLITRLPAVKHLRIPPGKVALNQRIRRSIYPLSTEYREYDILNGVFGGRTGNYLQAT